MQSILSAIFCIVWGLGSGIIIAGGIVAFITIIGIVPLMAHRTQTTHHSNYYENAIMLGVFVGSILSIWHIYIPIGQLLTSIMSLAFGVFVGVLVIALAEVLDVFPITDRRIKIKKGVYLFVIALALGKLVGSLYFWLYPISTQLK